jgi:hypothetical protein
MAPKRDGGIRTGGKGIKAGVDKIKRGTAAEALLRRHARRLAAHANLTLVKKQKYPDYSTGFHLSSGTKEPTATVFTQSNHAKYSNAKHNTLLRILGEK